MAAGNPKTPSEKPGGLNLYGYVGNGPIGAVDPLGLDAFSYSLGGSRDVLEDNFMGPLAPWQVYDKDRTTYEIEGGNPGLLRPEFDPIDLVMMFFPAGRVALSAEKVCVSSVPKVVAKIPEFVEHGAKRALERGFSPERIAQVLKDGVSQVAAGRYGPQTRITLGKNTVVIANSGRNAGKVINTFSSETVGSVKGYWVEP